MVDGDSAPAPGVGASHTTISRALPVLLALAILATYAVSLRGGFLNYDDDWLTRDNPVFKQPGALRTIWTDVSANTRHQLGAEYLPVRDTLVWLELRLFGPSAFALRAVSLLLYIAAALLLRAYLRLALPAGSAELAAWLFALHPVHAESVAWLAGQKDLVALLFVAAALLVYARDRHLWAVPLLALGAMFGKSVAVVAPLLLLLHDFLAGRRPRWPAAATFVATAVALLVHVKIGRTVGMMAAWPGGSRLTAVTTMGPVWLRYLGEGFVPLGLSVHHDVPIRTAADPIAWLCYGILGLLLAAAVRAARTNRMWLWAFGWFAIPLLPTSQVLAPLQNLMADRYLLLAVLGPCVVLAALAARGPRSVALGLVVIAAVLTFGRARTFADSVALWEDATARSPRCGECWYELGMAREGDAARAELAFRRALEVQPAADSARRAGNNLAALLTAQNRLPEAQAILRANVERFPDDPKALNNLASITARLGPEAETRRLYELLITRFPHYAPGLRNYRNRYGITSPVPPDTPPSPAPPPAR
jgi:tetratricopeptide (TPR) repeat protein